MCEPPNPYHWQIRVCIRAPKTKLCTCYAYDTHDDYDPKSGVNGWNESRTTGSITFC